ncbi:MAG: hypothetical protein JWR58_2278 [Pseudonocardia sp.]|nr:hypothetical protein [Pseudonocardia sp.]
MVAAGRRKEALDELVEECGQRGGTMVAVPRLPTVLSEHAVRALGPAAQPDLVRSRLRRLGCRFRSWAGTGFSPHRPLSAPPAHQNANDPFRVG